jgi:hypothetical protein
MAAHWHPAGGVARVERNRQKGQYVFRRKWEASPVLRSVLVSSVFLAIVGCSFIPGTPEHAHRWAEKEISKQLLDPESARFRNVHVWPGNPHDVCGEVSGRNSFNGYTQFKRFVALPAVGLAMIEHDYERLRSQAANESERSVIDRNQQLFEESWSFCARLRESEEEIRAAAGLSTK